MKKCLLLLAAMCGMWSAQAQSGLVAHWDMDDSVNDASGNAHHGMAHNITPAVGKDGVMGHAYSFNGVNSWIFVPYTATLNMSNSAFSIYARLQVKGYYQGTCHANSILNRGQLSYLGVGSYSLYFTDGTTGVDCSDAVDSAGECFLGSATASAAVLSPTAITDFNYAPHIASNRWYDVVVTFNDTVYKLYVNDTLMNTAHITTPGVHMGTSTDPLSIGYDVYDSIGGYPYAFKGVIDDIKLYNRALDSSEVHTISTTAVHGIVNDRDIKIYPIPASKHLMIDNAQGTTAIVYNIVGLKVDEQAIAENHHDIDIQHLKNGVYILQVTATDGSRISQRFLKE